MTRESPNLNPFIELLNQCFIDEDDFEEFLTCFFINILNQIPSEKTLAIKIVKLMQIIHRDRKLDKLLAEIKKKYKNLYDEFRKKYTDDFEKYESRILELSSQAKKDSIQIKIIKDNQRRTESYQYSSLMIIIHDFTNNYFHVEVGFWNEQLENKYLPILTEYGEKQNNLSNIFHQLFKEIDNRNNNWKNVPEKCLEFTRIEFFVSREFFIQEKELLIQSLEFEYLEETIKLYHKFPVVFRLKQRIKDQMSGMWNRKWKAIRNHSMNIPHLIPNNLFQNNNNNDSSYKFNAEMNIGFGLKPLQPNIYQEIFEYIFSAGIPIFLWLKHSFEEIQTNQCLTEIQNIFNLINDNLDELPEIIVNLRQQAFCQCNDLNHIGNHVCLLWDDPTRIPIILTEKSQDDSLFQTLDPI